MLDASKIQNKNLFNSKLVALYEKSKYDDIRVRTYLALAMGKTGDLYFGPYLTEAVKNDVNLTNRIAAIRSLGMLKYDKSCKILKDVILNSEFDSERLSAIISLGVIGNKKYRKVLVQMLDYEEPNIRWDAAIALAKMGDKSGINIIINLLDRKYYDSYPSMVDGSGVDRDESDNSIYTAIAISQVLIDSRFKEKLIYLSENDKNIKIREFALKTLNDYYK